MWSLEFVEVPDESQMKVGLERGEGRDITDGPNALSPPQNIPGKKRGSLAEALNQETTAAERLQVFKDPDLLATKTVELGSSAESDSGMGHYSRVHHRDNDSNDSLGGYEHSVGSEGPSSLRPDYYFNSFDESGNALHGKGDDVDSAQDVVATIEDKIVKPKPGDPNSPSADFVLVSETEVKDAIKSALPPSPQRKRKLRDGFKWQRQLVFRSKLTMHTAFERKDNKEPAAVTALAVSR